MSWHVNRVTLDTMLKVNSRVTREGRDNSGGSLEVILVRNDDGLDQSSSKRDHGVW